MSSLYSGCQIYIFKFQATKASHASYFIFHLINLSPPTELVPRGSVVRLIWKTLESVFRLTIRVIIIRMVTRNPESEMSDQKQDG